MRNIRLILTLMLATSCAQLDAAIAPSNISMNMDDELKAPFPSIWLELHSHFTSKNIFPPELSRLIINFIILNQYFQLFNCVRNNNPDALAQHLNSLSQSQSIDMSTWLLKKSLAQFEKSLFDIKGARNQMVQHYAACDGYTTAFELIFKAAGPKACELLFTRAQNENHDTGWTALHFAACEKKTDTAKAILDCIAHKFGQNNAWDLIWIRDEIGMTAWNYANKELREIMEQYNPSIDVRHSQ